MRTPAEKDQTSDSDILLICGAEIASVLDGKQTEVVDIVKTAYQIHGRGQTSLPHSTFLLFPNKPLDRIIALPAYLGGSINSAGVKWISSFPGNIDRGIDRASAVLILNSMSSGRPKAILEGSIISAMRTAASAALAAQVLQTKQSETAGLIGCGVLNFEIARFLLTTCPAIRTFILFDLDPQRALAFQDRCNASFPGITTRAVRDSNTVFRNTTLVSFATTAGRPHIQDLSQCLPNTVILHISLRDLTPEIILASNNVVDDVDHVCRAQTSIHLAEQQVGHRRFVRCTLGDILAGTANPQSDSKITVFSPFGLGVLDIAVGEYVLSEASSRGKGHCIESFFPECWNRAATVVSV